MEISARACTSWRPVSATDTLNLARSRSRTERTTALFSLSEEHPGRDSSHVCEATTIGRQGKFEGARSLAPDQAELASVRATSSTV